MALTRIKALPMVVRHIIGHPLNRGRPLRALARFLLWQLGGILRPGSTRTFIWINGAKLHVGSKAAGVTGNVYSGLHDFPDMAFLLCYLRPTDLMVDVGANEGEYTILSGVIAGAHVVSIEPIPDAFDRLTENVALNNAEERIQCYRLGLGDSQGTLRFTKLENTVNHVLSEDEVCEETIEVPIETLDSVLSGRSPSVLKIDVEGFEMPVLQGTKQVLQDRRLEAVIIEMNQSGERYGYSDDGISRLLARAGFSCYRSEPFGRQLKPVDVPTADYTGNAIFLRNLPSVRARIREAPTITILGNEF